MGNNNELKEVVGRSVCNCASIISSKPLTSAYRTYHRIVASKSFGFAILAGTRTRGELLPLDVCFII